MPCTMSRAPFAGQLPRAPTLAVRPRPAAAATVWPSRREAVPEGRSSSGGSSSSSSSSAPRVLAGAVATGLAQKATSISRRPANGQTGTRTLESVPVEEAKDVEPLVAPERYQALAIIVLCFLVTVICALDRAAMSVAILPMSDQYGYADSTKGLVASAYFWGYTLSNLVVGVAATQISPTLVLTVGVVLWSAFTVLTPASAGMSVTSLLACRALMGVSEGACLPTIQQLVSNWVPLAERGRAIALVTSGVTAGTVGALFIAPTIVSSWGWPSVFYIFGISGFLWALAWAPVGADGPKEREQCIPYSCEINWDTAGDVATSWNGIEWDKMLNSTAFRGVVLCGMAHNTGLLLMLSWLPTYFAQTFHLGVSEASMLSVPPWISCFLIGNASGWAADWMIAQGAKLLDVRKGFQLVGSLGPAACLAALAFLPQSQQSAEILFTLGLGLGSCSYMGFNSAPQDMAKRTTSVVYGVINAAGCLAASAAIWLTGVVLDAAPVADGGGGFQLIFGGAAAAYVVGAVAFTTLYRGEQEFS